MRSTPLVILILTAVIGWAAFSMSALAQGDKPDDPADQIAKLARGRRVREKAAEALAVIDDPRIVPALRERLKHESDFHVRLAIHYALASQGEKSAIGDLIASLHQTGHLGAVYLGRVTGKDYLWEVDKWNAWNERTTEQSFRDWIRQWPARDEWEKFRSLYSARWFERLHDEIGVPRMSEEDRKLLAEMPTAKAWQLFESAIEALEGDGNRRLAAERFREIVAKYAKTVYASDAKELADLLDKMVEEDRAWKEPDDVASLTVAARIEYDVYHLRDVVAHQWSQPGYCHVLAGGLLGDDGPNAAKNLRDLREASIPALLDLLDDRRPIRAVGYWRDFHPTRTILRYQDAASQILGELLPGAPYVPGSTSSYFSGEEAKERTKLAEQIRKSWQRDKDKSPLRRRWAAVDDLGIYPALKLLDELANDLTEKPNVLAKLGEMYDERHWVFQPQVAEAMARLGDTSKVAEVLKHHRDAKYGKFLVRRPDDSGASINAEEAAKRLAEKYPELNK
jgi:hypothetical protein